MDDENMSYDDSEKKSSNRLSWIIRDVDLVLFIVQNKFHDFLDIHKRFVFIQLEFVFVNIHVA